MWGKGFGCGGICQIGASRTRMGSVRGEGFGVWVEGGGLVALRAHLKGLRAILSLQLLAQLRLQRAQQLPWEPNRGGHPTLLCGQLNQPVIT